MIETVPRIRSSVALNEDGKREASSSDAAHEDPNSSMSQEASSVVETRRPAKRARHVNLVIKPSEYALAAFRANGILIPESQKQLASKFRSFPPSTELTDAYTANVLEAIRKNNLPKLKELHSQKKLNVDACNKFGDSVLHLACRRSHTEIAKFLLEHGANVHVHDDYKRTPLHDALWTTEPNPLLIDTLMKHGACYQIIMEDVRGFTPFDYVRQENWGQWLRFLWERKSNLKVSEVHPSSDEDELANE